MKPLRPPGPALPLVAAALALAPVACGGPGGRQEFLRSAEEHALEDQARPAEEPRDGEPPEIFYDLTRYDWYRRGEPLIAGGRAYQPSGGPEPAMGREFTLLGRFEGVAYYGVEGAEPIPDVVYVPVSPGYWQPFGTTAPAPSRVDTAE